ncbi:MAG: 16S rRNA (adenine(1518)-N(6)/adenine(1519)-N(6))-dimethyltransferase RsmA [bacterium]|nr:16S rRNA (adenine(1518)-N(6)/adenine(1519)-N(6))-dimethyltransferase RsmA [bacterium]
MRIKTELARLDLKARKSLGQNFLHDEAVLQSILHAADLRQDDWVLEIGAGLGVMTERLSAAAGQVVALEIDPHLHAYVRDRLKDRRNLQVVNQDILKYNGPELPDSGVKVIANLPYYISTPILMHLIEKIRRFSLILVMLQKEVAERITADPGTKKYGSLSVAIQYHTETEIVTFVPRTAFHPVPAVDSAVVKLTVRNKPPVTVTDEAAFFRLVRASFAQRRKTMRNALIGSRIYTPEQLDLAFKETGIASNRRAETLSIEEFAQLDRVLHE